MTTSTSTSNVMNDETFDALARLHQANCRLDCVTCQLIDYAQHVRQRASPAADPSAVAPEDATKLKLRVFLDDVREAPVGWTRTRTVHETLKLLRNGSVAELSLDHDLGDKALGNGYDVLRWIERQVVMHGFKPPILSVHSANPPATQRMKAAIATIARIFHLRLAGVQRIVP